MPTTVNPLFVRLSKRISVRAIVYVEELIKRYLPKGAEGKPPIPPICNCRSVETAGYPCIHLIIQHQRENISFELSDFHHQWHLYELGAAPAIDPLLLVQDPLPIRGRGRPRGAGNLFRPTPASSSRQDISFNRSTQREPSAFEPQGRPRPRGRPGRPGRPPASTQ